LPNFIFIFVSHETFPCASSWGLGCLDAFPRRDFRHSVVGGRLPKHVNENKGGVLIYIYGSFWFVFLGIFQICDWQASPNSGSIFQSMGHI
jgi:hypothetical protein